jgi:CBS domain-containing protein
MTLREILLNKGHAVHTIRSDATLQSVVETLIRHNCGSLVVCDRAGGSDDSTGRMVGIITERDLLKACARQQGSLAGLIVADVMTREVTTGSLDSSVEDTMGLMTRLRIRHLPIIEDEQLVGLISIGDVVKTQHDRLTMENHYLKSYIQG